MKRVLEWAAKRPAHLWRWGVHPEKVTLFITYWALRRLTDAYLLPLAFVCAYLLLRYRVFRPLALRRLRAIEILSYSARQNALQRGHSQGGG